MSNFKTSFEIAAPAAPVLKIESLEELRQVLGTTAGLENYVIVGGGTNLVLNDKKSTKWQ
jgi:UDP-N-acetylenolpyruvoylglucosamine reductase